MDNIKNFKFLCFESRKKLGYIISLLTEHCNDYCVGFYDPVCRNGDKKCGQKDIIKSLDKAKRFFANQLKQKHI